MVEETGQYFQTIATNNLLPYENLQTLKRIYEEMQEDFHEKLRMTDEMLQDLSRDNEKWMQFNTELKRLEALFHDIGSMLESKNFTEKSLEEKQEILEVNFKWNFMRKRPIFFSSSAFVLILLVIFMH